MSSSCIDRKIKVVCIDPNGGKSVSQIGHRASDLFRLAACASLHGVSLHFCGGFVNHDGPRFCETRKVMRDVGRFKSRHRKKCLCF